MGDYIEFGALARVIVVGVLLGSGLPALYALGVQAFAGPGSMQDGKKGKRRLVRSIVGWLCFGTVFGGIAFAVGVLVTSGH